MGCFLLQWKPVLILSGKNILEGILALGGEVDGGLYHPLYSTILLLNSLQFCICLPSDHLLHCAQIPRVSSDGFQASWETLFYYMSL